MNNSFLDRDYSEGDFEVKVSELLVATADDSDHLIDESIGDVLKLLRKQLNMDVVFVSEFAHGQRWFRHVEQAPGREVIAASACDPLEAEGKLPPNGFPVGTYYSTPIVLSSGEVYGTLGSLPA